MPVIPLVDENYPAERKYCIHWREYNDCFHDVSLPSVPTCIADAPCRACSCHVLELPCRCARLQQSAYERVSPGFHSFNLTLSFQKLPHRTHLCTRTPSIKPLEEFDSVSYTFRSLVKTLPCRR